MTHDISDSSLSEMSKFIRSRMGLDFPHDRWQDLKRGLKNSARELGFKDLQSFINRFLSTSHTKNELDKLAEYLTIGETFFFRNKNLFQVLRDHILLSLIIAKNKEGGDIRLWSAGCSTGEEPYSIAMIVDQMLPATPGRKTTIIASDINMNSLKKAQEGLYSRWSFRETPNNIMEKYFTKIGKNSFEISSDIKEMVHFFQLNLAEGIYPSLTNQTQGIDVIFCRNVLMYFTPTIREQVVERLTRSLAHGGWLILSSNESAFIRRPELHKMQFPGVFLYRKKSLKKEVTFFTPPINNEIISNERNKDTQEIKNESMKEQYVYNKAIDYFNKGCYREATKNLSAFLSSKQSNDDSFLLFPESMALLAKSLANLGRLDEAIHWSEKAIEAEKLNPDNYYLLATIFQEQGRLQESIKSFKQALYLNPEFILAHFALGNLFQQQGNLHESKKHLKNAHSLLLSLNSEDIVPSSDGITVAGFIKVVESMIYKEKCVYERL